LGRERRLFGEEVRNAGGGKPERGELWKGRELPLSVILGFGGRKEGREETEFVQR